MHVIHSRFRHNQRTSSYISSYQDFGFSHFDLHILHVSKHTSKNRFPFFLIHGILIFLLPQHPHNRNNNNSRKQGHADPEPGTEGLCHCRPDCLFYINIQHLFQKSGNLVFRCYCCYAVWNNQQVVHKQAYNPQKCGYC